MLNKTSLLPIRSQNIQELFECLSLQSPICRYYYTHWLKKNLTLEQSLELSLKGVTDYCYELMRPISADWLVLRGEHLDPVKFVIESDHPLYAKLIFLVEHSTELVKIAMKYQDIDMQSRMIMLDAEVATMVSRAIDLNEKL